MLAQLIAQQTGLAGARIEALVRSANHRYKVYSIPKRSGAGTRQIAHPSRELKVIQSWMSVRLFRDLPVHASVYSYRQGLGIRQNAEAHKRNRFLLRLDFRDFFPSITRADVARLLNANHAQLAIALEAEDRGGPTQSDSFSGFLSDGSAV
jgi:RNA-directed DNA polymerase